MPNQRSIAVIGAGPCGLSVAVALRKLNHNVTVYELRDGPSTIGGSVNIMPMAVNLLVNLGVDMSQVGVESPMIELFSHRYGSRLGGLPTKVKGRCAQRALRQDIQNGLLKRAGDLGINVVFGSKIVDINDDPSQPHVTAKFENGKQVQVDMILGCDGIHSAIRRQWIEPERDMTYTGITAVQTVIPRSSLANDIPFITSGVYASRTGNVILNYCDPKRESFYFASVAAIKEAKGKEGWKALGADHEQSMRDIRTRFGHGGSSLIQEAVETIDKKGELFYYPIYSLSPWGKWSKGRVLLLGDAAHAMPPQGESTGFAIEDACLFARILENFPDKCTEEIFSSYEKTRRKRIEDGWIEAHKRLGTHRDKGWLAQAFMEWLTWAWIYVMQGTLEKYLSYDVLQEPIQE